MMNKPSVIDQSCLLVAVILRSLILGSRNWGLTASFTHRLLASLPFATIGAYAANTQNSMLIILFWAAMVATLVITVASDKWGVFLAGKLQEYLWELESVARQAALVISNLPYIEEIRLSKIDFTSAILPIAPPPPRAHLAG